MDAEASFHSYYPVPATARAISAALRRRGLQPSTARDKRCAVQWVPRSRVAWARVLGGTLASACFFVSQGLTHKDRLFRMLAMDTIPLGDSKRQGQGTEEGGEEEGGGEGGQGLTHKDRMITMDRMLDSQRQEQEIEGGGEEGGGEEGGGDFETYRRDESMYDDAGRARAEAAAARADIQEYVPETHLVLLRSDADAGNTAAAKADADHGDQHRRRLISAVRAKLSALGDRAPGPWVLKAGETNNALGIVVFNDAADLERQLLDSSGDADDGATTTTSPAANTKQHEEHVMQRYVACPLLLDGAKFHLRVNVLVVGRSDNSGCDVYVHGGVVAHVATEPFAVGSDDKFVHVTNHGVQQAHPDYDRESQTLDLAALERRLVASRGSAWEGCGQELLRQACVVAAGVFRVAAQRPRDFRPMGNCFEVFGFDFLPRDCSGNSVGGGGGSGGGAGGAAEFKLQLLEVNGGPALEGAARPDICRKVVDDVLRVVLDPWYPPRQKDEEKAAIVTNTQFFRVLGEGQNAPGVPERKFAPPRMLTEKLASYTRAVIDLVKQQQKEWDEEDEAKEEASAVPAAAPTPASPTASLPPPSSLPPFTSSTPAAAAPSPSRDAALELTRTRGVYNDIVREVPVSVGSAMSMQERDAAGLTAARFVYGEIPFMSMADAFRRIRKDHGGLLKSGGHFLDVGSGTGKALVAAALLHDFQSCTGIEILEALHKGALGVLQRWHAAVESGMGGSASAISRTRPWAQLRSVHGDILVEEKLIKARAETEATVNIGKMDVVFANATCFDGALMESLAKAADRMRPGTFFVSTTNVLPSVKWEIVDTFASKGSWGSVTVYIHKRRSKKNALLHRLAHSAAGTSSRTLTSRGSRY